MFTVDLSSYKEAAT